MTRTAISPRLATRTLVNMRGAPCYPHASSSSATASPPTTPRPVCRGSPTRSCPRPGAPRRSRCARAAALRAERVITSDLRRASETAAILGFPDARRDARFREIDVGSWAGRPLSDFPDEHRDGLARRPLQRPTASPGRPAGARRRRRRRAARGGTWLVVCHGGVVRAALSHVTGADPRHVAGPANASVTVLRRAARLEAYAWTPGQRPDRRQVTASSPQGPRWSPYAARILGPL